MDDITIICATCRTPFIFSARDQEYFVARNFSPPRHCRPCRAERKVVKQRTAVERAAETLGTADELGEI